MKKLLIILPIIFLCGCATLSEMAGEIPHTDPAAEIGAVDTLAGDIVAEPWTSIVTLGVGYALALLRRWYKKKMGAQNV